MWDLTELADAIAESLRAECMHLDEEQAVYGLDARDELALHPLIRSGLASLGRGIHAEQRYPIDRDRKRRSEGERCDIVLTHQADDDLIDPLASGTLFGDRGVEPHEALWIEVKVAGQFAIIDGIGRPNDRYAGLLLREAIQDIRKLARAETIRHGCMLIIMFNECEDTARHDLHAWTERCLSKNIPIGMPIVRSFPINDRIGNGTCTVVLTEVASGSMPGR